MAAKKNDTPEVIETVEVLEENTPIEAEATEAVAAPEEPIDLAAFEASVDEALAEADETTGTLPEAAVAKVRTQYQALAGIKAKNAAKASLQEGLRAKIEALDMVGSRSIMQLTEEAAVAGKSTPAKKEVDPSVAYIDGLSVLTLALYLASSKAPEGVDKEAAVATATDNANKAFEAALAAFESGDKTESPLINAAVKVATSKAKKAGRNSTGLRRDLGQHIEEAFAAVGPGSFLSVADIRKFNSSVYGDERPSAGAISNRLAPKSGKPTTISGITVETRDNKLGAVKN